MIQSRGWRPSCLIRQLLPDQHSRKKPCAFVVFATQALANMCTFFHRKRPCRTSFCSLPGFILKSPSLSSVSFARSAEGSRCLRERCCRTRRPNLLSAFLKAGSGLFVYGQAGEGPHLRADSPGTRLLEPGRDFRAQAQSARDGDQALDDSDSRALEVAGGA